MIIKQKTMESKLRAKAELALMGVLITVNSNEEASFMADYITEVITNTRVGYEENPVSGKEVIAKIERCSDDKQVKHMIVNTLEGMVLIAYVLESPDKITTRNGVFSYVQNVTTPDFSEFGYTFYEDREGIIRRIG